MPSLGQLPDSVDEQVEVALKGEYAWWFRAVLDEFAFLGSDYDYRINLVEPHFRGCSVFFGRPEADLLFAFEPESELVIGEFWVRQAPGQNNVLKLDNLLAVRDPGWRSVRLRDDFPSVQAWVAATLTAWAVGLKAHAPDLLAGQFVGHLPWTD